MRTSFIYLLVSVIAFLFAASDTFGQANNTFAADMLYNYFNTLYKLDQNLINGVKYYKPREAISGNEFFLEEQSSRGKINVNGKEYANVFLKYDIVNQDVILEYDYPPGGKLHIVIDDKKVSDFVIFDKTFRKYYFPATGSQFFQTISAGNLVCLIYWKKILIPTGSSLQYTYQYSEEKKKTYLLMEDQLFQFGGRKSFQKLFPDFKKEIKQYLTDYNLELRNISDKNMARLLEFCSDLSFNDSKGTIR